MKLLPIFACFLFIIKSCGTVNTSTLNNNETPQKSIENDITFEYVASSRGAYTKIKIVEHLVFISKKRGKPGAPKKIALSDWNKLLVISKKLDLETISNLEVPSKNFQFDGAPIAHLKVITNGKTHETPAFDHGNPPKKIAELVKEILSISEMIE